ncbi:hypothetical protein CDD83_6099 [Cordyceps sp. RAO-2017]|nr:hypothetical protein CDD83_6099 [Cordyceps sp. RAO-2017]
MGSIPPPPPPTAIVDEPPPPPPPDSLFDPVLQDVRFYGADGATVLAVPLPAVDAFNDESVGLAVNAGAQLGASLVMLAALLALTPGPAARLRRPSALLQLAGLLVCLVRAGLLVHDGLKPSMHFYVYWSGDVGAAPAADSVFLAAGHVVNLLLVLVVELALVHQAWAMVSLWPPAARYGLGLASALVTLAAMGFRLAFTVLLIRNDAGSRAGFLWLTKTTLVTNALSIFWFCALFNAKLLLHLISKRGLLPSARSLSSMEVLVMTNGVLMVVPVIFAGLEWGHFPNFEPAALTVASVAIILPLGTLAAQRMTFNSSSAASNFAFVPNSGSSGANSNNNNSGNNNSRFAGALPRHRSHHPGAGTNSATAISHSSSGMSAPFKTPSFATSCGSANQTSSLLSKCERGMAGPRAAAAGRAGKGEDHFDLELRQIDSSSALTASDLRFDSHMEKQDDRS